MSATIEVRIGGQGSVRDGSVTRDKAQAARCDLCNLDVDAVASTTVAGSAPFACKACLRGRLEAMTVGSYMLRDGAEADPKSSGLPWGKVSG